MTIAGRKTKAKNFHAEEQAPQRRCGGCAALVDEGQSFCSICDGAKVEPEFIVGRRVQTDSSVTLCEVHE